MHVRATNWALFTEIYMALTLIYSKDELLTLVYIVYKYTLAKALRLKIKALTSQNSFF